MKKVKITLEVLTNMLSFGDDKNSAEFRITELKSLMRNTFRELYYFKDKSEMKESEDELFGNMKEKSPIRFKLIDVEQKGKKEVFMLPHKKVTDPKKEDKVKAQTKCLGENTKIELYMITHSKSSIELYVILLVQASILGALGKRSRKGFGSFRVINIEELKDNKYKEMLEKEPNEILTECDENLGKIFEGKYRIRKNIFKDEIIISDDKKKMNNLDFPYITKIHFVKIEKQYSNLIKDISQLTHDRLKKTDFVNEIENKNKINKNILGNCKHQRKNINRFASPVSVSFWAKNNYNDSENDEDKYMIIKELNYNYILSSLEITDKESVEANEKYIQKYVERLFEIGGAKK